MTRRTVFTGNILFLQAVTLLLAPAAVISAQELENGRDPQPRLELDLRDADMPAVSDDGKFVAVPIPFSNPTLGTGLIGAAAYFYPQTDEQARMQPASMTGLGVMYTSDHSFGLAIGHDGYWSRDRWRYSGTLAYADVTLPLVSPEETLDVLRADWGIKGWSLSSTLSRRVGRNWFIGVRGVLVDVEQEFSVRLLTLEFALPDEFRVVGLGARVSFDTRDIPTNAYSGQYFEATALRNLLQGTDVSYESYSMALRSYHSLNPSLVLAWQLSGCAVSDGVPLWDACSIDLRGFATTDYLGKASLLGEVEARWKLGRRWGVAAFAGAGRIRDSFSGEREREAIPSYGLGLRFTVQPEKRINMRLDFARSTDSDSVHLSVGEAF